MSKSEQIKFEQSIMDFLIDNDLYLTHYYSGYNIVQSEGEWHIEDYSHEVVKKYKTLTGAIKGLERLATLHPPPTNE